MSTKVEASNSLWTQHQERGFLKSGYQVPVPLRRVFQAIPKVTRTQRAHHPRSCIYKERNSKQFQVTEPTNEDFPKRSPIHSTKYDPRRIPSAKPKIGT
jgi:hypothetical protein